MRQHYAIQARGQSTGSSECWEAVLTWLSDCQSHPECHVPDEPPFYPTRLLDIGSGGKDSIRLIVSADTHPQGGYVTLSHRWGDANFIKLTKQSHQDLKSGIALHDLPLTFQHAIEIARRLNKQFIWIDSLCIFQDADDKSDWLIEAALMDRVYTNGFLNISATAGRDNSCGLFATRDPEFELTPAKISCPVSPAKDNAARRTHSFMMTEVDFFEREVTYTPLNRRAWVLQERLLAPRVLHFGPTQLLWECRRAIVCERFPKTIPEFMHRVSATKFKSLDITTRRPLKKRVSHMSQMPLGRNSDLIVFNLWMEVAVTYAHCQLSFGSDKAVALSGIAKVMCDYFQDEYVAGLWRRNLEGQLLWFIHGTEQSNGQPSNRPLPYRAPTWSWLSVDGAMMAGKCLRDGLHFRVLDVDMKYSTPDTTGLILGGSLTVRGRLRPLQVRVLSFTRRDGRTIEFQGLWTLNVGGKDLLSSGKDLPPWERIGVVTELDVPHADFDASNKSNELFIMSAGGPWVTVDDPYEDGDTAPGHMMLLLKCVDRDKAVFHRFGLAFFDTEAKPDFWEMVREYDVNEADMPCVAYDAEGHLHTFILE